MDFYTKLIELCKQKGVSRSKMADDIGISRSAPQGWAEKGAVPRFETIKKIADYFGVPVNYFYDDCVPDTDSSTKTPILTEKGEVIFLPNSNAYMIPVFESVSAGFGTCPNDNIVSYEICNISSPSEAAETICIKVKGDSMYPKIEDGDVIQVHKQTSVDSGKIAVVLLDGEEALVKKAVYGSDWIELQSFNPLYPIMRFDGRDVLRVQVLGLVRKIIKNV